MVPPSASSTSPASPPSPPLPCSPCSSPPPSSPPLSSTLWRFPGDHNSVYSWLLPLRLVIEDNNCFTTLYLDCFPDLAEKRLLKGPGNSELESSPVSFSGWMMFSQVLGKCIAEVPSFDAGSVLFESDISTVSTLTMVNGSKVLPVFCWTLETCSSVEDTKPVVPQPSTLPRISQADVAVSLGAGNSTTEVSLHELLSQGVASPLSHPGSDVKPPALLLHHLPGSGGQL